jgi:hypothetical protein
MTDDPIVAEIHRIRERIWDQCHGSEEEMAQRQKQLPQDPDRLIDVTKWKLQHSPQAKTAK